FGDEFERFVPRHALEAPFALAAVAHTRMEQSIGAVHAIAEAAHLLADVAVGDRIGMAAVDLDELAALHRHFERAAVRAIERTRRVDDGRGTAKHLRDRTLGHSRKIPELVSSFAARARRTTGRAPQPRLSLRRDRA